MRDQPWAIETSYDRVASEYTELFFNELSKKPFDRDRLDAFVEGVRTQGIVCDLGCGPGHIARYLTDKGVKVCGVDLSAAMIQSASQLNPDITFYKGDMRALDFSSESFAGLVAFYSMIHLQRHEVPQALHEFHRVLQPQAPLLLAFHRGEGDVYADNWLGHSVSIGASLFTPDEMSGYLRQAGFQVETALEREPYDFEHQTRRVYIHARK